MTENIQTKEQIPSSPQQNNKKKKDYKKTYSLKSMIDLVKYPVLTEKTSIIFTKNRQYTFDVDKRLTKTQIKKLFETLFQVNIIGVNTHIPPRKTVRVGLARGYRPAYKRIIITLKENQTLNYKFKVEKEI